MNYYMIKNNDSYNDFCVHIYETYYYFDRYKYPFLKEWEWGVLVYFEGEEEEDTELKITWKEDPFRGFCDTFLYQRGE